MHLGPAPIGGLPLRTSGNWAGHPFGLAHSRSLPTSMGESDHRKGGLNE